MENKVLLNKASTISAVFICVTCFGAGVLFKEALSLTSITGILFISFAFLLITIILLMKKSTKYKESEERLDRLLESTHVGYWDWRAESDTMVKNEHWANMLGYDLNSIAFNAKEWIDFVHPDDRAMALKSIRDHIEGRTQFHKFEYRMCTNDGHYKWILDQAQVVGSHIYTDITKEKQLEKDLEEAKTAVLLANRTKSAFLASMSHEIRTPLNSVIGLTEILLDGNLDEEQREYTKVANLAGESLLNLVNDILDLSKVESGEVTLEKVPFFLSEQIEHIVSMLSPRAYEKNLKIKWSIAADVPAHVLGDPSRLRQIFFNLIGNAIKFSKEGDVTILVTSKPDAQLLFSIQDCGIGIPPNKLDIIFEPFKQVDDSTTRRFGGTGLGLAISKRLILLMGGTIFVASELGKGSLFYFTCHLPSFEMERPENPEKKEKVLSNTGIKPMQILLVDDAKENHIVIQAILKSQPHIITIAENGLEALNIFKKQKFDIVLMDTQMPVMDGIVSTREMRKLEQERNLFPTPIIALTANAFAEDIAESRNAGSTEYVTKPLRKAKLLDLLERFER